MLPNKHSLTVLGEQDADFYEGKLAAAEYFLNWELPLVSRDIEVLSSREATCNNVKASYFLIIQNKEHAQ